MKKLLLAVAFAGALAVAYGSLKKHDQQVKAVKGEKECQYKKVCSGY